MTVATPIDYLCTVREAHGGEFPLIRAEFIDSGSPSLANYYVAIVGFCEEPGIDIPLPIGTVLWQQRVRGMQDDLPFETLEHNISVFVPRAVDVVAYALATYDSQPTPVQGYLDARFGPVLAEMRKQGARWWASILK